MCDASLDGPLVSVGREGFDRVDVIASMLAGGTSSRARGYRLGLWCGLGLLLLDTVEVLSADGRVCCCRGLRFEGLRLAELVWCAELLDNLEAEDNQNAVQRLGRFSRKSQQGEAKRHVLLPLHGVRLVLSNPHDAVSDQLVVVDNVVDLRSQHALNIVAHIAENNPVSLRVASGLCGQRFDLQALENRDREFRVGTFGVIEDGAASAQLVRKG